MFKVKLNKNEVKILITIQKGPMTISQLASGLKKNPSWISRNVDHLEELGFVNGKRVGKTVLVKIDDGPMGACISTLISEESMLNIEAVLSGSGLRILPLILEPGNNAKEIARRSSLSLRTVQGLLSRWRKMGVVALTNGCYMISERHQPLIEFVKLYSYNTIIRSLGRSFYDASIVWHWRDEFMFSTEQPMRDSKFISAATTRLRELDYDVISVKDYYFYNPLQKIVSEEEALMQSLRVDPENPRLSRLVKNAIVNKNIDANTLLNYAGKYGIKTKIEELVESA